MCTDAQVLVHMGEGISLVASLQHAGVKFNEKSPFGGQLEIIGKCPNNPRATTNTILVERRIRPPPKLLKLTENAGTLTSKILKFWENLWNRGTY